MALAPRPAAGPVLYAATAFTVDSAATGASYRVTVAHCGTRGKDTYGLVVMTDADWYFGAAVDTVRSLQLTGQLPALLVVGIGYGDIANTERVRRRIRDFTPTDTDPYAGAYGAESGGAARFRAFVADELLPWLAGAHPIDAGRTLYFGHSLGGLFGTTVLLSRPGLFTRYALASPSLWWGYGVAFEMEAAYARVHRDLPVRLYLGVGSDEGPDGFQRESANMPTRAGRDVMEGRQIDLTADVTRMAATLRSRAYPSLRVDARIYPGEFHSTVPAIVFNHAVRVLFDAPTAPGPQHAA